MAWSPRIVRRKVGAVALGLMLAVCSGGLAHAQSTDDGQLSELLKRIEKLEQDKQSLSRRIEAVEQTGTPALLPAPPAQPGIAGVAALDESSWPGAAPPNRASDDAGDSEQTARKLAAQGKDLS